MRGTGREASARLLAVVAALAGAAVIGELYRAGVPVWHLRKPAVYHFAVVAALAIAAARWVRVGARRAAPVVFVAIAFAVYLGNDKKLWSDSYATNLVPYAVVRHGTLALDRLGADPRALSVVEARGHLRSVYPIATGLLALPVYLPAALGPGPPGAPPQAEKLAASLLAAGSVAFVLATFLALGLPLGVALLAAAAYGLASPVFSTVAQSLWQHTGGVFALSAAIYLVVRARDERRLHLAAWAGLAAGIAVTARPTNLPAAAALVACLVPLGRRAAWGAAAVAALPLALVAAYHTVAFGAPWKTGYGAAVWGFNGSIAEGLAGVLFSPTRGLVTFVPWSVLAVAGLARGARREPLYRAALVGVASIIAVTAPWFDWPGGWCYGPRLLSDATPLLALGLVPLLASPGARRWAWPALVATALLAAWLSWLGAYRWDAPLGNAVYLGGDVHAMEWWRYPPVHVANDLLGRPSPSGGGP